MHLQKFLVVLSSLTVVGLSAPVVSQEGKLEIIERNKPNAIIPAGNALNNQQSLKTNTHHISQPTKKDAFRILDKTTELALSCKNTLKPIEILIPTPISPQKMRGYETIAWVPPPPTSKIPEKRGDETVVWVQPPPTPKIPA
ncbi:hypothetical protein BOTCAL_0032g00150 [Botryotinia calthae]|uniref:Uncharacterized protein n=1 Tax=Botryotinia calthae TaxID=38488 RepID=A0A4Y8DFF8_9HELO|nr:hypothetical protein BOTCAL_0032g00150 [Botryotinia calthae]